MTDSMNFGPDWIRNLSSEGSTGGGAGAAARYQLADYRYGREEMLALFDRNYKPPACLTNFKNLYSEPTLIPLALQPNAEEELRGGWQPRPTTLGGPPRGGRGGSMDRGGRGGRGRGIYPSYGRANYETGWGNGENPDWSPRKEFNRPASMDNWRRARNNEDEEGWRNAPPGRNIMQDKWGRQTSWRAEGDNEERTGPPERGGRTGGWGHEQSRGGGVGPKRSWDNEDHLPEWATEYPSELGGSFDERGAFHGSDDEQEGRGGGKGLQKSTSQQHISNRGQPPLLTSKSSIAIVHKNEENSRKNEVKVEDPPHRDQPPAPSVSPQQPVEKERKTSAPEVVIKPKLEPVMVNKERAKSEDPKKVTLESNLSPNHQKKAVNSVVKTQPERNEKQFEDTDFEKLQEDFVMKLGLDEEPPRPPSQQTQSQNNFDMPNLPPPPNLTVPPPVQDKWFYQDPQGLLQGPFTNVEMSEWFKAGYFAGDLKVRRNCDERFYMLAELITICAGANPFHSTVRFPVLKNDISKMPEGDVLQLQYLTQVAAYKQAQARVLADPWSTLTVQQQELAAQRLIMQQQQQVPQELPYMPPQTQPTNPLMQMINQMQQANKLPTPTSTLLDKPAQNMPGSMDPHIHMQMSNLLNMQSRLPGGLQNHGMPTGMPGSIPTPPDSLSSTLPGLGSSGILPGMPGNLGVNVSRSMAASGVNQMRPPGPVDDPISSLLKQLQQQKQQSQQQSAESLWQQPPAQQQPPWQQQKPTQVPEPPISMWDLQNSQPIISQNQHVPQTANEPQKVSPEEFLNHQKAASEKAAKEKAKEHAKEQKKKKEFEEKQQKKEAEEKRKEEQRRLEAEKKAEAEKRKKEEDRIRRELEKAKKDAEEKRMKELEEKRRIKEQRKLEEEARKQAEEVKLEEERMEKERREQREMDERQRMEEQRRQEQIALAKAAPWSQANSSLGLSLAEIQKAERERKLQEAALQQQRAALEKELQQQQQQVEKPGPFTWAKKPMEPRKVKSLAEIQAEEQERLAKEAAEARVRKEKEAKEAPPVHHNTISQNIWSSQNLTWANTATTAASNSSQWSSSGFWDDLTQKVPHQSQKPSNVSKSSSMSMIGASKSQGAKQQQTKAAKQQTGNKKEQQDGKKNHNHNNVDDFTTWCTKQLSNFNIDLDKPTFIEFLRAIESAYEVKEYCKEYLGESGQTAQFANNFLEKRRSVKPKNKQQKDDMCAPAPAITPSSVQHGSTDFQEVKGKKQKNKKSKMMKLDSRILGFNVTSAPDRLNVGDRDYGDNF